MIAITLQRVYNSNAVNIVYPGPFANPGPRPGVSNSIARRYLIGLSSSFMMHPLAMDVANNTIEIPIRKCECSVSNLPFKVLKARN